MGADAQGEGQVEQPFFNDLRDADTQFILVKYMLVCMACFLSMFLVQAGVTFLLSRTFLRRYAASFRRLLGRGVFLVLATFGSLELLWNAPVLVAGGRYSEPEVAARMYLFKLAWAASLVSWTAAVLTDPPYVRPLPALRAALIRAPAGRACAKCAAATALPAERFPKFPWMSHCSTCQRCVVGFDHHCWWIGSCVGSANYWRFFSFLCIGLVYACFATYHMWYIVILSFFNFVQGPGAHIPPPASPLSTDLRRVAFMSNRLRLLLACLVAVVGAMFFLFMVVVHVYLILRRTTSAVLFGGARAATSKR